MNRWRRILDRLFWWTYGGACVEILAHDGSQRWVLLPAGVLALDVLLGIAEGFAEGWRREMHQAGK